MTVQTALIVLLLFFLLLSILFVFFYIFNFLFYKVFLRRLHIHLDRHICIRILLPLLFVCSKLGSELSWWSLKGGWPTATSCKLTSGRVQRATRWPWLQLNQHWAGPTTSHTMHILLQSSSRPSPPCLLLLWTVNLNFPDQNLSISYYKSFNDITRPCLIVYDEENVILCEGISVNNSCVFKA